MKYERNKYEAYRSVSLLYIVNRLAIGNSCDEQVRLKILYFVLLYQVILVIDGLRHANTIILV